ncbi:hypothetical protein JOD45_002799 [Scopulibacillus daqui]|uniref:Uncharacterized protein n=1 Tax=Scopulibacillus daqui TaxID=1469162 RepID=A0ABS2Q2P6_9BACL|nr:hypothetical protein [Scopulibacillus daqui]
MRQALNRSCALREKRVKMLNLSFGYVWHDGIKTCVMQYITYLLVCKS